ncbi:YitT family protein [Ureaplasma diversum]|nr:YitT family protein [Ureaplasma diversum]
MEENKNKSKFSFSKWVKKNPQRTNELLKRTSRINTNQTMIHEPNGVQIEKVRYKAGLLKFASLYTTKRIWIRYLAIVAFSLLTGLLGLVLVQNTGIYSPGITGLSQGIARLAQSIIITSSNDAYNAKIAYDILFWLLVVFINVPLLIFAYFKIGKHFALMSLVYILTAQVFGFIIAQIPNTDKIMIFGNNKLAYPTIDNFFTNSLLDRDVTANLANKTLSFDAIKNEAIKQEFINFYNAEQAKTSNVILRQFFDHFKSAEAKDALYDFSKPLYEYHLLIENKVQVLPWTDPAQAPKIPSILVYAFVYGILDGIFMATVYIAGGSSGGTDIVSFFYSKKNGKPIGSILTYFNVFTLLLGIILGSFVPGTLIDKRFVDVELFFSPNMIASVIASILLGVLLNAYFPKHKSLKIDVYAKDIQKVIENLRNHDFNNSITISQSVSDASIKVNQSLQTISPYVEFPNVIRLVREVDQDCLIVVSPIVGIDGEMVMRKSIN